MAFFKYMYFECCFQAFKNDQAEFIKQKQFNVHILGAAFYSICLSLNSRID